MRTVELISGCSSSVLGFGCASVVGAIGPRQAKRAIHAALEDGVTHFDLARSYGYGDAEAFVGRLLKGRRDRLVLVSKFGIQATTRAKLFRPLKPFVRILRQKAKRDEKRGRDFGDEDHPPSGKPKADLFHERIEITPSNMERSLERTLRALKTDYLDLFMVHEPLFAIKNPRDLIDMASRLKKKGKIRGWGVAFDWSQRSLVDEILPYVDVAQFNCSPGSRFSAEAIAERGGSRNVIFSPLRTRPEDMSASDALRQLFLMFPQSVLLCSMFNLEHIRENCRVAGGLL